MIDLGPEQITSTEYVDYSVKLFESTPSSNREILLAPLTDDRASLIQISEFFKDPLFFDEESSQKLIEVTEFLVKYPVKTAMWETEVHEQSLVFRIETKTELDIEVAVLTYGLKDEMQSELENFIESENVHQITLQETRQQLYVESKTDLHAEFENIEGTGVKVSGYEIRMTGDVLEASFGGKWYSLESATDKNSDIYQLLSKVTETMKNGQTAVTVSSHVMSPATNKKFEIKPASVEYIINVFDIKAGKVYNYILVDKTIDDVKEILAKIGIELNLENPDLTFGAVNGFDKKEFEKENFGTSVNISELDLSAVSFENTGTNLIPPESAYFYPFTFDFNENVPIPEDILALEMIQIVDEVIDISRLEIAEQIENQTTQVYEGDPVEPEPNTPLDGMLLILDTTEQHLAVDFFAEHLTTSTFGVEVVTAAIESRETETAWQVHAVEEAMRMEELVREVSVSEHSLNTDVLHNQTVSAQELAEQVIFLTNDVALDIEVVTALSTLQVDNIVVQPTSTFGVNNGLIQPLKIEVVEVISTDSELEPLQTWRVDHASIATIQEQLVVDQVILLQKENGLANSKEEEHLYYLSARVESSFRYPLWMDTPTAYAIRKQIELETGKQVSELQEVNGKIVGITI